ncbi:MAG: tRNA (adenosine(37)-N6)-dimethylallyltransferase MiaA [Syntrophomonadaceae bacterium]|nr:tRNA (adenosine(37)-N6)-dimethylallyltransferase MiaA [Syntrophomonadaceae bacterium]
MRLAAIVGPTAVGKSRLAIHCALRLGAEILSCDSMQVYRGMDIGTAKPSREDRALVPHHLLDLVEPDADFTVADYQARARQLIEEINRRHRLPMLVGGTGLYYQAVVDDYQLAPMPGDAAVRRALEEEAERDLPGLYARLQWEDPVAAASIRPRDRKRIVRALEVCRVAGRPFSSFQKRNPQRYHLAAVGLTAPREVLYQRIEQRVDAMLQAGLLEEVAGLWRRGFDLPLNSMQALGYRQLLSYLHGRCTLEEAVAAIKRETRRYAKRQLTWFRRDGRIRWFDVSEVEDPAELAGPVCEHIGRTLGVRVE